MQKLSKSRIIFCDLDGTLIDTEPLYQRFWKEASKHFGYELKDEEELLFRSLDVNLGIQKMDEISHGKLHYHEVKAYRVALMKEYFLNHDIELKDGAISFLNKLNNKDIYIVTSNDFAKAQNILEKTGLDKYVKGIISAKDVKRGKPFPDVYEYACHLLNVNPEDVVVFEDSPNGLMSSYSAHCYTVMVEDLSPYNEGMNYVNYYLKSLNDL